MQLILFKCRLHIPMFYGFFVFKGSLYYDVIDQKVTENHVKKPNMQRC